MKNTQINFFGGPKSMNTKRILAALVCAATIFTSVFATGCSSKKSNNNEQNASNTNTTRALVTLNMFMLTEDNTDPDAARAVQMAINEITLPKYKTTVKINYLKADEYWAAIDAMEKKITDAKEKKEADAKAKAEAKAKENTKSNKKKIAADKAKAAAAAKDAKKSKTKKKASAEDKATNFSKLVDKIYEAKDITIKNPQIDIFLVNGADKLYSLIDEKRLTQIDTYLSYEDKILKEYTYPTFFAAANVDKKTWGVPANDNAGGQYEYFVFNKDLLDKYGFKIDDMTQFRDLGPFLSKVKAGDPGVVPLTKITSLSGYEFFGGKEGNAIGIYKPDTSAIWSNELYSIFSDKKYFYRHCLAIEDFRKKGYVPSSYTQGTPFAVDIRTSEECPKDSWTENGVNYVSYIYKLPRVKADALLGSTFVVSSLSAYPERAMELISLFNTNAQLANLLQYGIKGVNYIYNEDTESVSMLNQSYSMNPKNTGNRYIKYPLQGEEDYNQKAKEKNVDIVESAFFGFHPKLEAADTALIEKANAISQKYYNMIMDGQGSVDSVFASAEAELTAIGLNEFITNKLASPFATYAAAASATQVFPPIVIRRLQELYKQGVNTDAPPTQKSPMDSGKASDKGGSTKAKTATGTTTGSATAGSTTTGTTTATTTTDKAA
jgi:Membrane protein involved in colicin uptake